MAFIDPLDIDAQEKKGVLPTTSVTTSTVKQKVDQRKGFVDPLDIDAQKNQQERYKTEYARRQQRLGLAQPEPSMAVSHGLAPIMEEMAAEIGPIEALAIGGGRGLATIGRGLGLVEPADVYEQAAIEALRKQRPIATGAGEIAGESAPFIPAGMGAGALATRTLGAGLAPQVLASGLTGAFEGGVIQAGKGEPGQVVPGAITGGAIGVGAELLFPVIGRMANKLVSRIRGRVQGPMLDASGQPTQELQEALDTAGISFDELTQGAIDVIQRQKPGAVPEQVARRARFEQEAIPATRGEITQRQKQQALEARLFESAEDIGATPFRQFKLKQSDAIKERMQNLFGEEFTAGEAGDLIKKALTGERELLRSQKNELYAIARDKAKEIGGMPIFINDIQKAIPEADILEDLAITAPEASTKLSGLLEKYGLKGTDRDIDITPLTIENFERFRKNLNTISRSDKTNAIDVAIGPIKRALDKELDEMVNIVGERNLPKEVLRPLREARQIVRTMKTEFSPQSFVGRITNVKPDGVTPIVEASKTYDKISSKATPIEDIQKLVIGLDKAGSSGQQAKSALQSSIILDLIDAGFGTESRKVSGVKIFNPIAFKRRLKNLGMDKVNVIFKDQPESLKSFRNIDAIASDMIPQAGAVPKGSATVIADLANRLGLVTITGKVPGGALAVEALRRMAGPIKAGALSREAVKADVEVLKKLDVYPGIASAIAIPTMEKLPEEFNILASSHIQTE